MTFTRARGITSCDTCGLVVGDTWREKAAHTAAHTAHDTTAARQARIDAINQESEAS